MNNNMDNDEMSNVYVIRFSRYEDMLAFDSYEKADKYLIDNHYYRLHYERGKWYYYNSLKDDKSIMNEVELK